MPKNLLFVPLILLVMLMPSCDFDSPKVTFNRYDIKHIGITKADLVFIFNVENPNNVPLSVSDISYSVALDGNNVTSGSSEGFSLNGRETKESEFPVELEYAQLIGPAAGLVQKFIARNGTVKYSITGDLTIKDNIGTSARVPLDAEGEIKLF